MGEPIKVRKGRYSSRVYLQDLALLMTQFQVGSHFGCTYDRVNRRMVIHSGPEHGSYTVSQRKLKTVVKPVIDVKGSDVRDLFDGCQFLQIEIFGDQIIITGYEEYVGDSDGADCLEPGRLFGVSAEGKIIDLESRLRLRQKLRIVLSREELDTVVGGAGIVMPVQEVVREFARHGIAASQVHYIREKLQRLQVCLDVASYFSGAGLLDLGFQQEGFELAFATDYSPHAVATYRLNLGDHVVQGDLRNMDSCLFPETHIVIGGPPCVGFSNANRRTHHPGNVNDDLVEHYIRRIRSNTKCVAFVLENVPQILTKASGKYRALIRAELKDFYITETTLIAADFGTPQLRRRTFFIGGKFGPINPPLPTHSASSHCTVRDAFEGLTPELPNMADITVSSPDVITRMRLIPPGGNWKDLPPEWRSRYGPGTQSNILRRLHWDRPAFTLANFRKMILTHPHEDRIVSVRECARLQDLPDDFVFAGTSLGSRQLQAANGVPVRLARAVARAVRQALERFVIRSRLAAQPAT